VAALLASCGPPPAALSGDGEGNALITQLFWLFLAISVLVWVLVVAALLDALRRGRRRPPAPELGPHPGETGAARIIVAALALTLLTLVGLTTVSFFASRDLAAMGREPAVTIKVTSYRWWWAIRYDDPRPDRQFVTANEIHIPVGEPVKLQMTSTDVIHSFWVPSLAGKQDLIPGQETDLTLLARRPGIYSGACAEFCGHQHANMQIKVVAEPRPAFEAWQAAQLETAAEPADAAAQRGRELFLSRACIMCHAIRGTKAAASVAPDLTHLASRRILASGALPMTRPSLAAWIADPQGIKPGSNMPRVPLTPEELDAVVSYLAELR
jgi:cytochrome c oxidase subunit 2